MSKAKYLFCAMAMFAVLACTPKDNDDNGDGGEDKNSILKAMSFNVRYNAATDTGDRSWDVRKLACVKMIKSLKPDVIGMQEPRTAQRTYLKDNLSDYEMLEVPNTGTGTGGNSVLLYSKSRFVRVDWGYFFQSTTPDQPSIPTWSGPSAQWHTTVWAHLKEAGTDNEFWFFTTHLPANTNGDVQLDRIEGVKLNVAKMQEIAGEDAKVIMVGDMNCSYDANDAKRAALTPYYNWMSAGRSIAPTGDAYSFNNFGSGAMVPARNLDHIFYRNMTMAMSFRTITDNYGVEYISDHYPLLLTVIF
jgi:endonuclease/exonuclease/phosphatase family metal-dependent hydrolase